MPIWKVTRLKLCNMYQNAHIDRFYNTHSLLVYSFCIFFALLKFSVLLFVPNRAFLQWPCTHFVYFFHYIMELTLLADKNIFVVVCRALKLKDSLVWLLRLLWVTLQWFLLPTIVALVSVHFGSYASNSNN